MSVFHEKPKAGGSFRNNINDGLIVLKIIIPRRGLNLYVQYH